MVNIADKCAGCEVEIKQGDVLGCPSCGAKFCSKCAQKTKDICPNCYHSLEYIG